MQFAAELFDFRKRFRTPPLDEPIPCYGTRDLASNLSLAVHKIELLHERLHCFIRSAGMVLVNYRPAGNPANTADRYSRRLSQRRPFLETTITTKMTAIAVSPFLLKGIPR